MITPFAALDPYIEEAEASFNTCIDSVVLGFKLAKTSGLVVGTPSMIDNGWVSPKVFTPLIKTEALAPDGFPDFSIYKPGTFPCNACITLPELKLWVEI